MQAAMTHTDVRRFWQYVDKDGPVSYLPLSRCWIWTAGLSTGGYGRFQVSYKNIKAHRYSFVLEYGNPTPGMYICHHCDIRSCVNPGHLYLDTAYGNMRAKVERGRQATDKISGALNGNSILTDVDVRYIRESELSNADLARMFSVDPRLISKVRLRLTWKHIP